MSTRDSSGRFVGGGGGSFSAQVSSFSKATLDKVEGVRRGVTLKLFNAVILDTPVLTGRLRGNWRVSEGKPVLDTSDRVDPSGAGVLREVEAAVAASKGDTSLVLSNSLPYAARIEYDGWSHTKAPEGMVRRNVRRFNGLIKLEAAKK